MATQPVESQLDARLTEFENNLTTRLMQFENSVNARLTEFENILDAGMVELRASNEKTNDRINKLLYIGLAVIATGLVNLAVTVSLRFL